MKAFISICTVALLSCSAGITQDTVSEKNAVRKSTKVKVLCRLCRQQRKTSSKVAEYSNPVGVAAAGCSIGGRLEPKWIQNYYSDVATKIKLNPLFGQLTNLPYKNELVCNMKIDSRGEIKALEIIESSGSKEFDGQGLDLLRKAAPYEKHRLWNVKLTVSLPKLKIQMAKPTK